MNLHWNLMNRMNLLKGLAPLHILNRRLYNPEIAKGDFSDIKGDISVAK